MYPLCGRDATLMKKLLFIVCTLNLRANRAGSMDDFVVAHCGSVGIIVIVRTVKGSVFDCRPLFAQLTY